jgi:hypothetical protein
VSSANAASCKAVHGWFLHKPESRRKRYSIAAQRSVEGVPTAMSSSISFRFDPATVFRSERKKRCIDNWRKGLLMILAARQLARIKRLKAKLFMLQLDDGNEKQTDTTVAGILLIGRIAAFLVISSTQYDIYSDRQHGRLVEFCPTRQRASRCSGRRSVAAAGR